MSQSMDQFNKNFNVGENLKVLAKDEKSEEI